MRPCVKKRVGQKNATNQSNLFVELILACKAGALLTLEHRAKQGQERWPIHEEMSACLRPPRGGYSLFSDDRDDHLFLGVVIGDLVFLGVVQAKSFKKIKLVHFLLGYKNRSFEYASLINSSLLVFLRLVLSRYILECTNFMA